MKKIKSLLIIVSILIISAVFSINVFGATPTFTMTANAPSTATKGSNITISFTATDLGSINNGFAGYEGYINYDTSKLEFVNAVNNVNGWVIYTNKLTDKIKFLGYDDNPPNNTKNTDTKIFTATFKVLTTASTGDTVLSMTTLKGSTGAGLKVVASDFSKTIKIEEKVESKSSNANLGNLSLTSNGNQVALNPTFNASTTNYSVTVSNNVDKINIAAVAQDSKATISGVGEISLNVGNNVAAVVVTAEDGTKKTYNVNITRKAPLSNNSNLSGLTIDGHILSPTFNPNTTSYKVNVDNGETSLNISALTADPNAKVTITGNTNLSVGKNNVLVEVEAEDGSKKVYVIEATRTAATVTPKPDTENKPSTTKPDVSKSSNANLKSISGIPGLQFSSDKTSYDVLVPFETNEINVSALAADSKAKVSISNGNLKNMEVGKTNTVTIVVTAEDSSVKVYTINVKRSEYSSETDLKELVVNDKDLLVQETNDGGYRVDIDKNSDKLDISAIPKSEGSKIKIIGNENLKSGKNTIIVEVTDKNGFTKSYKIDAYKEEDNGFVSFFKDYWLLLLFGGLILLLFLLILFLNRNNKTIIYNNNTRIVDNKKLPPEGYLESENKQLYLGSNDIDNTDDMLYNSNDNSKIIGDVYKPRHVEDSTDLLRNGNTNLDAILGDEDVSKVKKEVTIVRDELHGDDLLEKEYTITENLRRK